MAWYPRALAFCFGFQPAGFPCINQKLSLSVPWFLAMIARNSCLWKFGLQPCEDPRDNKAEISGSAGKASFNITFCLASSRRTSAKTSRVEGRGRRPRILPRTSSRSRLRPARNSKTLIPEPFLELYAICWALPLLFATQVKFLLQSCHLHVIVRDIPISLFHLPQSSLDLEYLGWILFIRVGFTNSLLNVFCWGQEQVCLPNCGLHGIHQPRSHHWIFWPPLSVSCDVFGLWFFDFSSEKTEFSLAVNCQFDRLSLFSEVFSIELFPDQLSRLEAYQATGVVSFVVRHGFLAVIHAFVRS